MFFDSIQGLFRVLIVGTSAYAALVILLRVSGKRTLSKLNAFDFVVTVALGSTLATVLLSRDVALLEGVFAFALLIALQAAMTALAVRSSRFSKLLKAEPRLIFFDGRFLPDALREERVTENEVRAVVRNEGRASMDDVQAVVLESDGGFSVIGKGGDSGRGALDNVNGMPRA